MALRLDHPTLTTNQLISVTAAHVTAELPRPDALTLYLFEAAKVPFLAREEETSRGRRLQGGDEQAREHMIRANLRLMVKIAREYDNLGVPLLDLITEGDRAILAKTTPSDVRAAAVCCACRLIH